MSLEDFGWTPFFAASFEALSDPSLTPARVIADFGRGMRLVTAAGTADAVLAGKLRRPGAPAEDRPAVGDWVACRTGGGVGGGGAGGGEAAIEAVLERRTRLARKVAGTRSDEQVVAANVDTVLVGMGLDGDFNPRRLERFLVMVWESGAAPAVVLTKSDLCADPGARRAEVEAVAVGVPVVVLSNLTGEGLDALDVFLRRRETLTLVGSSGVGKSTLINRLLGEERLATGAVRAGDDRGQHTTSHRELYRLPGGALLIDNPGVRELAPAAAGDGSGGLGQTFADIEELAPGCRYRDCGHGEEPGCAVRAAVEAGELAEDRWLSFLGLTRELAWLERRRDQGAQQAEKRKWKTIHKAMRKNPGRR